MTPRARTPFQREQDLAEITRRYLRGETQAAIAQVLGLSQQQISYDVGTVRKRWQKAAAADMREIKARELAKIDELERTYWEAWTRSLEETRSKTVKARGTVGAETPQLAEQVNKSEERMGNPAYLAGVQWCIERRCRLLGIDAPVEQKHDIRLMVVYGDDGTRSESADSQLPMHNTNSAAESD
jgi:hypothetical protein